MMTSEEACANYGDGVTQLAYAYTKKLIKKREAILNFRSIKQECYDPRCSTEETIEDFDKVVSGIIQKTLDWED